jgi:hypothetical protein
MPTTPYLNAITHGECTTLLRQIPDACVDLVLTDPLYLVRYRDRSGRTILNDDNGLWIFPAFLAKISRKCAWQLTRHRYCPRETAPRNRLPRAQRRGGDFIDLAP